MINENEPCLKLRNRTTREEETYCKYYIRKFRGYVRSAFINAQTVGLFVMLILILAVSINMFIQKKNESMLGFACVLGGLAAFSIICIIIEKLWFWKYAKYVVVTNEGIWIMWHGAFWRKTDFASKRRFLSPRWSMYGWSEIKITSDDKARPRSPSKMANLFADFDYAVIKSSHLTTLFLTRFDGVQQLDFLEETDANEILAYAREQKRKKRRKKDTEIIEDEDSSSDE